MKKKKKKNSEVKTLISGRGSEVLQRQKLEVRKSSETWPVPVTSLLQHFNLCASDSIFKLWSRQTSIFSTMQLLQNSIEQQQK
jgi:hypothetical protein